MILVKEIKTNNCLYIKDTDFDNTLHININNSIYYWYICGITDYYFRYEKISELVISKGFSNLDDEELEIVTELTTCEDVDAIGYFMTQGLSQLEAIEKLTFNKSKHFRLKGKALYTRLMTDEVKTQIIMFIGKEQGMDLLDAIRSFKEDLKTVGILGTQYGDVRDGVMDYFESTGAYVNGGLKTYEIQQDMIDIYGTKELALQVFIDKLHNFIIEKFKE